MFESGMGKEKKKAMSKEELRPPAVCERGHAYPRKRGALEVAINFSPPSPRLAGIINKQHAISNE